APLLDVPMPQRLDSYPEHPVAVVLAHQLINGDLVAATPDGRPVDLLALDIVAGRPDPSACVIDVSYAAAPLCRLRVSAAGTAEHRSGRRLSDLYEVVGQAVRSAQWAAAGTLWAELGDRLAHRSATSVVGGDADRLGHLLARWEASPPETRCTIGIVQPGLRI